MNQEHASNPPDDALPPGVRLPRPTVWPLAMAGGVALVLAGLVLTLTFTLAGLVIFGIALAGWIRELRRE